MRVPTMRCALVAALVLLAGCAGTPTNPSDTRQQELQLHAVTVLFENEKQGPDFMQLPPKVTSRPLLIEGAACTLRNDHGSWSVLTPATVTIALSAGPLSVECRKEGFKPAAQSFRCVTPRARRALAGAQMGGSLGLLALVGLPAGALIGAATAGADADLCNYSDAGAVVIRLWPSEK